MLGCFGRLACLGFLGFLVLLAHLFFSLCYLVPSHRTGHERRPILLAVFRSWAKMDMLMEKEKPGGSLGRQKLAACPSLQSLSCHGAVAGGLKPHPRTRHSTSEPLHTRPPASTSARNIKLLRGTILVAASHTLLLLPYYLPSWSSRTRERSQAEVRRLVGIDS